MYSLQSYWQQASTQTCQIVVKRKRKVTATLEFAEKPDFRLIFERLVVFFGKFGIVCGREERL
jgi:hypothetical protein